MKTATVKRCNRAIPNIFFSLTILPLCKSSAVVIVDPEVNEVIGQAHTDSSHPLKHATMLCLDQVASAQGGGAWNKKPGEQTALRTEKPLKGELVDVVEKDELKCPSAKHIKCQYLCTGYDAYCTTEPCVM